MKRMMASIFIGMLASLAFAQGSDAKTDAKTDGKMIHVDFVSTEGEGMTMQAAVPLSLVSSVRGQVQDALTELQKQQELDFPKIWAAVRDAGPTEFLSVDSPEVKVKVASTKTHINIFVDQKEEDRQIKVMIPMALGDALFGSKELNPDTIIDALLKLQGQDLVKIESEEFNGRVWIE